MTLKPTASALVTSAVSAIAAAAQRSTAWPGQRPNSTRWSSGRCAALRDEARERPDAPGSGLSGGRQQRLRLSRAAATDPEVLLMDGPRSALDPMVTAPVDERIDALRQRPAGVIVTHPIQQAARVSRKTAFLHLGCPVVYAEGGKIVTNPEESRTGSCISGGERITS